MSALYLYLFQDPGLYYGGEFISVVESSEERALEKLAEYLKDNGRENHIINEYVISTNTPPRNVSPQKHKEYTFDGEKVTWRTRWKVIGCVPIKNLTPGVIEELHHDWLE